MRISNSNFMVYQSCINVLIKILKILNQDYNHLNTTEFTNWRQSITENINTLVNKESMKILDINKLSDDQNPILSKWTSI